MFLIYPVINTILISFKDARSQDFVGLDNYKFVFTDESMLRSIRNSALWIVLVPPAAVSIGLAFATLADRLRRGEAVAKSMIFLPMAISFVGAAVTWRLIYSFRPAGLRHEHRPPQRHQDRGSARTRCGGCRSGRGTTSC